MLSFLAQLGDEAGGPFAEAIAELFKLLLDNLGIAGGIDLSPPLLHCTIAHVLNHVS